MDCTKQTLEKEIVVITCGTFDLMHIGHLNMLQRCKNLGTKLIVGVSSDAFNFEKKKRLPIFNEKDRLKIIKSLKCVDDVFLEKNMSTKIKYCNQLNANIFCIGNDWKGKFDFQKADGINVVYLPRTPFVSTTQIINSIKYNHILEY